MVTPIRAHTRIQVAHADIMAQCVHDVFAVGASDREGPLPGFGAVCGLHAGESFLAIEECILPVFANQVVTKPSRCYLNSASVELIGNDLVGDASWNAADVRSLPDHRRGRTEIHRGGDDQREESDEQHRG
jgi:hypothetical protein